MKKIVVFCTAFLGGIIGFVGWIIACASQSSGKSEVLFSLHGTDYIFAFVFLAIALAGGIAAILECYKKSE